MSENYLRHSLPIIQRDDEVIRGGNQSWLPWKYMRKSACGNIAGTDLLMYLHKYRRGCQTGFFQGVDESSDEAAMPLDEYCTYIDRMRKSYFPVIPYGGMSGFSLALGLNAYFLRYRIPLRAFWGVRPGRMWECVEAMLKADVPVILSIGQNVPFVFTKHKVNLYIKVNKDTMAVGRKVKGHFVTVTGCSDEWIRITSWGKEFYIYKKDYEEYVKKHSSMLVSNILVIGRIRRRKRV